MGVTAIGMIGGVVSAVGSLVSGLAAMQAANYQAAVAKANAKVAEDNASRAQHRAQIMAQDQDALTLAMLGEQEAAQSATGVDVGGPSARLARKSAAELGRKDALNVRQDGEIEAYNFKVDAMNARSEGQLARMRGRSAMIGGVFNAASGLLSSFNPTGGTSGTVVGRSTSVSPSVRNRLIPVPRPNPRRSL